MTDLIPADEARAMLAELKTLDPDAHTQVVAAARAALNAARRRDDQPTPPPTADQVRAAERDATLEARIRSTGTTLPARLPADGETCICGLPAFLVLITDHGEVPWCAGIAGAAGIEVDR